jgi:hypothetical protein
MWESEKPKLAEATVVDGFGWIGLLTTWAGFWGDLIFKPECA